MSDAPTTVVESLCSCAVNAPVFSLASNSPSMSLCTAAHLDIHLVSDPVDNAPASNAQSLDIYLTSGHTDYVAQRNFASAHLVP